jgi:hypothetical protein
VVVVHDLFPDIYRFIVCVQLALDNCHGSPHAGAETTRLGE